jgi:hypothetical protein
LRAVWDQEVTFRILKFYNGPEVTDENFPSIDPEVFWLDVSKDMFSLVNFA